MVSLTQDTSSSVFPLATRTASTVSAPNEQTRLSFLDGLRGFAILMVMLRHYYMQTYHLGYPRWADVFGIEIGVRLFLVLSGFGLAWSYFGPRQRPFSARDFFIRRAARILPAYYVALLLAVVLALPMPPSEFFRQFITHATMTHNLFPETVLGIYGPFWSLALEFQFYLVFPIFLTSFRRWGVGKPLLVILIIQLTFRIYAMRFGTDYNPYTFTVQWSVLGRMFSFSLAMAAATWVAKWQTEPPPRLVCNLIPVVTSLLLIAGVLTRHYLGVAHPVTGLCWGIGFVGLILWCSVREDWLTRTLQFRPLTWLAVMSYSVFLVHAHILEFFVGPWYASFALPPSPLVGLPFAIAGMVFASWIFYHLVEKPLGDYFYHLRTRATKKEVAAT